MKHDSATPGTIPTMGFNYINAVSGLHFNFTYTANAGMRASVRFAVDTTYPLNFCYDLWIRFDDPSQILNMELDMNKVLADSRTLIMDCQCASHSGTWENNNWHASRILGNPQQWGTTWHHVRIFWHHSADGNTTTWDGVEFDGSYMAFNSPTNNTAQALGWAPPGLLLINFQIEGSSSSSGTVDAYIRGCQVWSW